MLRAGSASRWCVKWGAAAVASALIGAIVLTNWWAGWYDWNPRTRVLLHGGLVRVERLKTGNMFGSGEWSGVPASPWQQYWRSPQSGVYWLPRCSFPGMGAARLDVPLWIPAVGAAAVTVGLIRGDRWRAGRSACPKCGYDLSGLPAEPGGASRCPECGAAGGGA